MDPLQLPDGVGDLAEYAGILRLACGVVAVAVTAFVVRSLIRRNATKDDRKLEKSLQDALGRGDLVRAGDVQMRRGHFIEASRIFERAGDFVRAGRAHLKAGDQKAAATAFEKGGDFAAAAPLLRNIGEHVRAAECFGKSDLKEHTRAAAECYVLGGEHVRAAQIFEKLGDLERAADTLAKATKLEAPDQLLTTLENAAIAATPADRLTLWQRAGEEAQRLGHYERAARAFERAGQRARAAELYEQGLKRFDVAAAIYEELGNSKAASRLTIAAGGETVVLKQRIVRAREQGDAPLVETLETKLTKLTQIGLGPATANASLPTAILGSGPGRGRVDDSAPETRFEMLGELGRGGMGVVHKARDRILGRMVALKFLPPEIEPDSVLVSTFRREARAAAALSHPGIVTVYDVGTIDGRDFIAMELVEGTTLERVLADNGPLRPLEALETMEHVLEAVECAHQKAIIHRDLKPSNIMRTKTGIKVMDFGLAKIVGASKATKNTIIGGTPAYMPPEQLVGTADHRSDIFAIGAMFYELLTNTVPGLPDKTASMSTGYPTPRDRVPAVPNRLSELIMRCLEHDRVNRPQDTTSMLASVREMRAALQATMDELRAFVESPAEGPAEPARAAAPEARPTERRPAPGRRAPIPRED